MNETLRTALYLLPLVAVGCAGHAKPAGTAPAATEAVAPTGKVACHLDCSGKEETAYAATEAEAREALRPRIEVICNPDDGQFFIVCEDVE